MTKYILKHRNRDVAFFAMDEDGDLYSLEIASSEYMPILGNGPKNLAEWIQNRAIPEGRPDLPKILRETGCKTALEYLLQNLALSPSDSYWICPENLKGITWEEISLYQHPDGARNPLCASHGSTYRTIRNDSALTGSLEKYNVYRYGSWHLVKNGAPGIAFGLQNINEAFASLIHERLGFAEYTKYTLHFDGRGACQSCSCRYFTDEDHELISAYYVTGGICGQAKTPQEAYQEYIDACIANGLDHNYVFHFMDHMILTDFLITNTDRHWENFGILRDPDTLRFLALAPVFDSGTSMLYDDSFAKTRRHLMSISVHGICHSQTENLRLVHDKKTVDVSRLPDEQETTEFYMACGVPEERAAQIAQCFELKKICCWNVKVWKTSTHSSATANLNTEGTMRKRQTTKQHAYDMTAHMFLLTAYGWSHYPKSIYNELKWVPDLLANDEADEDFIAALQQVLCQGHYPGPQCQLPIVRDNLRKHYDISQEKADKVAEMLRNMQQRNLNTAKN